MGKVIPFRRLQSINLQKRQRHTVRLCVIDEWYPEDTRWCVQRVVQSAGSFRANKGFNDELARNHGWHQFRVSKRLISRFAKQVEPYVTRKQVTATIDGHALTLPVRKRG